jgi:ATP-dependent Lon protease
MTEQNPKRHRLSVLPLRDMVLFPGVTAPIGAGRPGTLRAIEAALKGEDRLIFAVTQRESGDAVQPEGLYTTGVIARIGQLQRGLGGMQLLLHGEHRATVLHYQQADGYIEAIVHEAADQAPSDPNDPAFAALYKEVRERATELGQKSGLPEDVIQQVVESVTDPGRFADLVAGYLEISSKERMSLLEELGVEERLRRVLVHVQRQIQLVDAQEEIKSKVQEELGERQREMFLREQLKAIRKELGDEDEAGDANELSDRLAKIELAPEARKEVDRELKRLERASRDSMEAQVIRTFLETVAELPWNERSTEHLELKRAAEILDEDHFGLSDVKDRVLEFLAVRLLRSESEKKASETEGEKKGEKDDGKGARGNDDDRRNRGSILLFARPPVVGKN